MDLLLSVVEEPSGAVSYERLGLHGLLTELLQLRFVHGLEHRPCRALQRPGLALPTLRRKSGTRRPTLRLTRRWHQPTPARILRLSISSMCW